jgi:flavin-dependent dehydrogenase
VQVRRGKALRFLHAADEVALREDGGAAFCAKTLFLATGKHDLHSLRRRISTAPDLVGVKCHLRLSPAQQEALSGHVEIVLLRRGYAGLQMVEQGMANLCLLVSRAQFVQAGGTGQAVIDSLQRSEPHLARRLANSAALSPRPLTIARVPYGFVFAPSRGDPKNLFRLGDQMGVIPSFTGDGMSIALHSAFVAASSFLAGMSAEQYHRRMRSDIWRQIKLADALYRVSTSPLARSLLMRLAGRCPGYLRVVARLTRVQEDKRVLF